ncbi:hypothetical protein ACFL5O_11460, partial [Myxococcota bacterium]
MTERTGGGDGTGGTSESATAFGKAATADGPRPNGSPGAPVGPDDATGACRPGSITAADGGGPIFGVTEATSETDAAALGARVGCRIDTEDAPRTEWANPARGRTPGIGRTEPLGPAGGEADRIVLRVERRKDEGAGTDGTARADGLS